MAQYRNYSLLLLVAVVLTASVIQAKTERNVQSSMEDVSRIIGGTITTIEKFPWQVLVMTQNSTGHKFLCGGSIISKTWIMSAAHCFTEGRTTDFIIRARRIVVVAGITIANVSTFSNDPDMQHNHYLNEKDIEDHLFIHPSYNNIVPFNNDIALIKLKKPLTLNKKVKTIALATETDFIPGKELITSGWGNIIDNGPGTDILHYVDGLKLIPREECKEYWSELILFTNKMICHYTEGRNICDGDSGGPVITGRGSSNGPPYVQIGINSWVVDGRCEEYTSAGFTDVAKFNDWINETISMKCKIGNKRCTKLASKGKCKRNYVLKTCMKTCTECGFPK